MTSARTDPCILVKTSLGMERIAAARIEEALPWVRAKPSPKGFKGLVLVYNCKDGDEKEIADKVVEADRIIPVMAVAKADPSEIAEKAAELSRHHISSSECFAVRTVRRGRHSFTSIDVNVIVGEKVRKASGACVNLTRPDKLVIVEILQDTALISIQPGSIEWKKMKPGKNPVTRLFKRLSVVQMPYLGPLDACRNMGVRIGREVQNFEVKELVVAPAGSVDARQLSEFLNGLFEGIESRYRIQSRSYHRETRRVPVYLQDIHQLVRDRRGEVIIVLEPEGEPVSKVADTLWELLVKGKRVNILAGSREGVPLGIYRYADLVIDVAPGVTLSTEYAIASALIAFATLLHDRLGGLEDEKPNTTGGGKGGEAKAPDRDKA
ncbi:MAG: SPOUT family RNA methylase [Desulfurococcales archaeon]|nr:SPOUT family RNA methylase [Desulfurococcales archaeon]